MIVAIADYRWEGGLDVDMRQEHIERADRDRQSRGCYHPQRTNPVCHAIADAAGRFFNVAIVRVHTGDRATIFYRPYGNVVRQKTVDLPIKALQVIHAYNHGQLVWPMQFEIGG